MKTPLESQGQEEEEEELQTGLLAAQETEPSGALIQPSTAASEVQHITVPFCSASEYSAVSASGEVASALYG